MQLPTVICIVKELMTCLLLLENTHFPAFYRFLPEAEIFSFISLYNRKLACDFSVQHICRIYLIITTLSFYDDCAWLFFFLFLFSSSRIRNFLLNFITPGRELIVFCFLALNSLPICNFYTSSYNNSQLRSRLLLLPNHQEELMSLKDTLWLLTISVPVLLCRQ